MIIYDEVMGRIDQGEVGDRVARNVALIRASRRMQYKTLSEELASVGHKLPPLALRRIEANERRIDVDDLAAFSKVFGFAAEDLLYKDLRISA